MRIRHDTKVRTIARYEASYHRPRGGRRRFEITLRANAEKARARGDRNSSKTSQRSRPKCCVAVITGSRPLDTTTTFVCDRQSGTHGARLIAVGVCSERERSVLLYTIPIYSRTRQKGESPSVNTCCFFVSKTVENRA